jgi:hypothetical protein
VSQLRRTAAAVVAHSSSVWCCCCMAAPAHLPLHTLPWLPLPHIMKRATPVAESGTIPAGNAPGETKWASRGPRPKADVKLTAGKAITVPIEELIDQVVKGNKVCTQQQQQQQQQQ